MYEIIRGISVKKKRPKIDLSRILWLREEAKKKDIIEGQVDMYKFL